MQLQVGAKENTIGLLMRALSFAKSQRLRYTPCKKPLGSAQRRKRSLSCAQGEPGVSLQQPNQPTTAVLPPAPLHHDRTVSTAPAISAAILVSATYKSWQSHKSRIHPKSNWGNTSQEYSQSAIEMLHGP